MSESPVVVVATRMRVRSLRYLMRFLRASQGAIDQARATPGFLGGALRIERGMVFWTLTVWDTGRSMVGFRDGGVHGMIQGSLADWASEGAFSVWRQDGQGVPAWPDVAANVAERWRPSEVHHPSAAQRRGETPALGRALVQQRLAPRHASSVEATAAGSLASTPSGSSSR